MRSQITEVILAVHPGGSVTVRSAVGPWRVDGEDWGSWVAFANAAGVDGWELFSKTDSTDGGACTIVLKRVFPGAGRDSTVY